MIKTELPKLKQWSSIQFIFNQLNQKNRLCWLSGGVVRDLLLDREPSDVDLTTDATEAEILELFPQAILIGREFGVYKIPLNKEVYDLTVFREEDTYLDGRRPAHVRRSTPQKDAERRDFTMNALFWDLKNEELIDFVEGLADIEKGIIRCVGIPVQRFQEDYLRVLRMVRFSHQLCFEIEVESYKAGIECAAKLVSISGERIREEILKLRFLDARIQFYRNPIALEIMKHNHLLFVDLDIKLSALLKSQADLHSLERHVLTELLFLMGMEKFNVELLQKRLKLSKDLRRWLHRCCDVQAFQRQSSDVVPYCLLLDESSDYAQIIDYFSTLEIFDNQLAQHIKMHYHRLAKPLIDAQDIIEMVPAHSLSKVLKAVRILQFQNKITDSTSAITYVKNLDVRTVENG